MIHNQKKSIIEKTILYLAIPMLVFPLILCLYYENEIDQLGKAFMYGPMYTFFPFCFIFIAILYPIHKNLKILIIRSIQYSLIYALCSIFPILLINNNLGEHQDYTISGIVVETWPGKGKSKPSVRVRNEYGDITFRIVREKWSSLYVGKNVSLVAKKGSLGLIYR